MLVCFDAATVRGTEAQASTPSRKIPLTGMAPLSFYVICPLYLGRRKNTHSYMFNSHCDHASFSFFRFNPTFHSFIQVSFYTDFRDEVRSSPGCLLGFDSIDFRGC